MVVLYVVNVASVVSVVDVARDVSTDANKTSVHFADSLQLHATSQLSSATRHTVDDVNVLNLIDDIVNHLPSMRSTYLQVAPVTPAALLHSRYVIVYHTSSL